ncbi:MAG: M12 family metallopeptidase [Spirochaetota bacterium]
MKFYIIFIFLLFQACTFDFTIGKWEDGIIPYYLKGEFSSQDEQNISDAMRCWESVCGVKFVKVSPRSSAYAIIRVSAQEWQSSIGENNSQCRMIFGRSYSDISVIVHELGHCLGLVHEHQRPDRDLYVNIIWNNILTGKDYNFDLIDNPLYIEQKFEYDYLSIMHYDKTAFSINGSPTIVSKTANQIDPSEEITDLDAARAREIYGPPFID